jgi:hypothetical protein
LVYLLFSLFELEDLSLGFVPVSHGAVTGSHVLRPPRHLLDFFQQVGIPIVHLQFFLELLLLGVEIDLVIQKFIKGRPFLANGAPLKVEDVVDEDANSI